MRNRISYHRICLYILSVLVVHVFVIGTVQSASGEVVFGFGDSITQGYPFIKEPGIGRRIGGYESKLESLFNDYQKNVQVLNYGVGGETTLGGLSRIDGVLAKGNVDYMLIMEGTNDLGSGISPHTTLFNLGIMVDKCLFYNVEPIIATLLPDLTLNNKNISTAYNPAIRELAVGKNILLCDQYDAIVDKNWDIDGLHPSDTGYQIIAQAWFDILRLFFDPLVALKTSSGQYFTADGGGLLYADRNAIGEWETFELIPLGGNRIALQAHNGQYLVAEDGGGGLLYADRNAIGEWETFKLITVGDNRVALRANNGQYLVAEGGGGVYADRDAIGEWETFGLINLKNNKVALRANNGQYLVAEGGGGGLLYADHDNIGEWETFELIDLGNNRIALRADNGQYLVAEGGGGGLVYADRDIIGEWETFEKIKKTSWGEAPKF